MRLVIVVLLTALALTASAPARADIALAQGLTVAPEGLAEAVLEYALVRRKAPDMELLDSHGIIFIDEDASMPLGSAIRRLGLRRRVQRIAVARLWERAERANRPYFYLQLRFDSVERNRASVFIGTEMAHPTRPLTLWTCCCGTDAVFERQGRRWRFVELVGSTCS